MDLPMERCVPFLRHPHTGRPWLIVHIPPPMPGDRVGLVRGEERLIPSGHVVAVDLRALRVTVEHDEGGVKSYPVKRLWRQDA